ncbi:MAG TPA: nucleotidyltransferase domain-containing protein [Thermoanaerobaculia bacterium]|jgi:predicted nucleotidyltransferase|nr:nucleotidyltransferase domain-containing protein [Thermoanaerobaculia bacterium]
MGTDDLERAIGWLDQRFGVETLWLFGSEAKGTATPESDLDLAALFLRPPTPLARIEAALELGSLLGREVDLIDLDRTTPILAMQVLRHGKLRVDRHPTRRAAFFSRTISMYEDLKIVRRGAELSLLERMAAGGRR